MRRWHRHFSANGVALGEGLGGKVSVLRKNKRLVSVESPGHVSIGPNVPPETVQDAIIRTIPKSGTR